MSDIIEEFLGSKNVARMEAIHARTHATDDRTRSASSRERTEHDVIRMRALMLEFVQGPYGGGIFDVWSGTDPSLYIRQMNTEFIHYLELRRSGALRVTRDGREAAGAAMSIATALDPYGIREDARKRSGCTSSASCARTVRPDIAHHATESRLSQFGADAIDPRGSRAHDRTDVAGCSGAPYGTWRSDCDIGSTVHLSSRDDESSDAGHVPMSREWAERAVRAPGPYDFADVRVDDRLTDPHAGSGEAQYHLIELDSRLSVLNDERTIPMGYGSAQEQLAESARIAARYSWWQPEEGVIPRTSYKRLTHVTTPSGRVTLDDERELARDIFSSDSRGFIIGSRM
jgi:hypothetical protein